MKLESIKKLEALLDRVPGLVDRFEAKSYHFLAALKEWLNEAEQALTSLRNPRVAEIAAVRGIVVAAEDGVHEASIVMPPRLTRRKAAASVAALMLDRAQAALVAVQLKLLEDVDEARLVLKQLLAVAGQRGMISERLSAPGDLASKLKGLWESLAGNGETAGGAQRVLALITYAESLLLMGEILKEWEQEYNRAINGSDASQPGTE